jgi:hypothetical protein
VNGVVNGIWHGKAFRLALLALMRQMLQVASGFSRTGIGARTCTRSFTVRLKPDTTNGLIHSIEPTVNGTKRPSST